MSIKLTKSIGTLLLSIWLILMGLATFFPAIGALGPLLAVIAIAAAAFLLVGR